MKKVINFIGARWIFISISIVLIAAGVVGFVVNKGFNYSIDFRPGLSQQFKIDPATAKAPISEVRAVLAPVGRYDLQVVGSAADQEFVIKVLAPGANDEFRVKTEAQILGLLEGTFGAGSVTVQASDFVGPRYASELFAQTIWIMLVAIILILIYAAFRFKFVYGMAAVLCLVHDALFMLAVNAVFRIEFSTTTVAAVLTIIGYSINDTIVIFDRVRENRGLMANSDLKTILNTSITQTLGRTILTSTTVFLSIIALFVLGSGDIKNFALLMLVGIFEGAYSTIFIASPIVYMWMRRADRQRKARDLSKYGQGLAGTRPVHERKEPEAEAVVEAEAEEAFPVPLAEAEAETAEYEAQQALSTEPAAAAPQPAVDGSGGYTRIQPVRRHKKRRR